MPKNLPQGKEKKSRKEEKHKEVKQVCDYVEYIETRYGSSPICNHPSNEGKACLVKCFETHRELGVFKSALSKELNRNKLLRETIRVLKNGKGKEKRTTHN